MRSRLNFLSETMTKIEAIAERSAENLKGLFLDMTEDIEAGFIPDPNQPELAL